MVLHRPFEPARLTRSCRVLEPNLASFQPANSDASEKYSDGRSKALPSYPLPEVGRPDGFAQPLGAGKLHLSCLKKSLQVCNCSVIVRFDFVLADPRFVSDRGSHRSHGGKKCNKGTYQNRGDQGPQKESFHCSTSPRARPLSFCNIDSPGGNQLWRRCQSG